MFMPLRLAPRGGAIQRRDQQLVWLNGMTRAPVAGRVPIVITGRAPDRRQDCIF
jgi:hypothetical protein